MITLLSTAVNATGASQSVGDGSRDNYRLCQVVITGTATCTIQGSLNGTNWTDIKVYTASGADDIKPFPFMRAVASGMTGATVLALLDATSL
jgi:uncharacterized protein YraI